MKDTASWKAGEVVYYGEDGNKIGILLVKHVNTGLALWWVKTSRGKAELIHTALIMTMVEAQEEPE